MRGCSRGFPKARQSSDSSERACANACCTFYAGPAHAAASLEGPDGRHSARASGPETFLGARAWRHTAPPQNLLPGRVDHNQTSPVKASERLPGSW